MEIIAYDWDFSITETLLQSQEHMSAFFADYDSAKKPFPGVGKAFNVERVLSENFHLITSLSIPLQEEKIVKRDSSTETFYFSKSLMVGADYAAYRVSLTDSNVLEIRPAFAVLNPLSHRFGEYVVPVSALRMRASVSKGAGLLFGIGYAGIFSIGSFFITYGVSYRI